VGVSKEIEALESLAAVLEMLSKKEVQLAELSNELESVKAENARLRSEGATMRNAKPNPTPASELGLAPRKVLILDHVKMFRINLMDILSANGYQVVGDIGEPDESAVMEMLLLKAPNIVTIDYSMPGLNCAQMIKNIKNTAPEIKIIVISAELSHDALYTLLKAGANDFVTKPVQQSRLISVLRTLYSMPT